MTNRRLNNNQLDLLLCLYKFRFARRDLIAKYQGNSLAYTHYRLNKLLNQGLISRNYSGKDKIQGKQAVYYLSTKGIRFLAASLPPEAPHILNEYFFGDGAPQDYPPLPDGAINVGSIDVDDYEDALRNPKVHEIWRRAREHREQLRRET